MIRAKLDSISREMLVGHDTGLDRCYYRPGTDELLQEYLKVVGLVTISQENRLRLENLKIMQRNESFEKERDEVIALRRELEPLIALKNSLVKEGILRVSYNVIMDENFLQTITIHSLAARKFRSAYLTLIFDTLESHLSILLTYYEFHHHS
jgi:hypothetical protein